MEVVKIKSKDGVTSVDFRRPNGRDDEVVSFSSKDEPRKEFGKALAGLTNDLLALCELDKANARKGTEVISVSIGTKKDVRNFVISGRRQVEAGTFSLSSPLVHEREEETGANTIPTTTLKKIEKLIAEAVRFVNGERTQRDLFDGQEEAAEG